MAFGRSFRVSYRPIHVSRCLCAERLDARILLGFTLFLTSFEFLMDQNRFLQAVNNLESSVVVQELEFAINRTLYGLL